MSLFKEGDEVGSMWGDGVVGEVDHDSDSHMYLLKFGDGSQLWFNKEGCREGGIYPSIWHKETGTPPSTGERPFEYPIYKRNKVQGCVIRFDGLSTGECVVGDDCNNVGESSDTWIDHTDESTWEDCEPPQEPKEMTVAEIEEALGHSVKVVK